MMIYQFIWEIAWWQNFDFIHWLILELPHSLLQTMNIVCDPFSKHLFSFYTNHECGFDLEHWFKVYKALEAWGFFLFQMARDRNWNSFILLFSRMHHFDGEVVKKMDQGLLWAFKPCLNLATWEKRIECVASPCVRFAPS